MLAYGLNRAASTIPCVARTNHSLRVVVRNLRRYSQASNSHEAFIEPSGSAGVKFLSLNRPQSKNAISMRMVKELQECLDFAQRNKDMRVLVLRSTSSGSFCAGADLIERRTMNHEQVSQFLLDLRKAFTTLENLPVATIAAIEGPALGGGLEMALACDFRIADANVTKIGLPETKLGIIPGAGGTQRAVRLLGVSKAKELVLTGRMLTAREAEDIGLVDYVSEPGSTAVDRAMRLANEIATNAPLALKAAKLAMSRAHELDLEEGLDFERSCYEPLLSTKDRMEALVAFKERRRPNFKGE